MNQIMKRCVSKRVVLYICVAVCGRMAWKWRYITIMTLYFTFFLLVSDLCSPVAVMFYDGG